MQNYKIKSKPPRFVFLEHRGGFFYIFYVIDGKQRNGTLLESDEIAPKREKLKNNIAEIISK